MSANLNLVVLAGNLTRQPELRYTPGGSPVTSFSIATNRKWKDAQGKLNDEACFVDCECWGTVATNVSQYLGKGSSVIVRGRLKLDRWTDRDGKARSKLKCVAEVVQFIGTSRRERKSEDAMVDELPPDGGETVPAGGSYDDDVPF